MRDQKERQSARRRIFVGYEKFVAGTPEWMRATRVGKATSRSEEPWARSIFNFIDGDNRDPFVIPVQVTNNSSPQNVGCALRRNVLMIVEEPLL